MGKVYFPKDGVDRCMANKTLVTSGGLGFVTAQPRLDSLVVASVLRCTLSKTVTTDNQEMNSSYDDIIHGRAEEELKTNLKPSKEETKEQPKEEVSVEDSKEEVEAEEPKVESKAETIPAPKPKKAPRRRRNKKT